MDALASASFWLGKLHNVSKWTVSDLFPGSLLYERSFDWTSILCCLRTFSLSSLDLSLSLSPRREILWTVVLHCCSGNYSCLHHASACDE